jgi:hypothetical protein
MPKKFFLPLLALVLAGCDSTAIEFAKQTRALLNEYQKSINDQISHAAQYYNRDADIAKGAASRQLNDSLAVERDERTNELAADYLEGRKPVSLYRTHLRSYAQAEYDARKASLESAVDTSLPYVQQLAKLEADKETVEALGKALNALQQKRSLKTEATDLEGFVTETKKDFTLMVCTDLKTKQTALATKIAAESGDQKTADQAQSDAITKLRTDRKCADLEKAAATN